MSEPSRTDEQGAALLLSLASTSPGKAVALFPGAGSIAEVIAERARVLAEEASIEADVRSGESRDGRPFVEVVIPEPADESE